MALLYCDGGIGEDCRYLVGKAQASRVDVGASDGGQSIVHDDGLGVHVASFVEVDLYALAQEQVVVGGGGFRDENAFVAADREHESHFHSSVARGFDGGLYAWGGDEIGGLEVDVALRMVEHVADEGIHAHDFVRGVDGEDVDGGVWKDKCISPPPVPLSASRAGE